MIIKDNMCYTKLLWLQHQPGFIQSINKVSITRPCFEHEGMAGYIETEVEFDVRNLGLFAEAMEKWSLRNDEDYAKFYHELVRSVNNGCHSKSE